MGSVVALYLGILTVKSFLFYRICSRYKRQGDYIILDGTITHLHDEKKKAIKGKLEDVSYPQYSTSVNGLDLIYTSVVKHLNKKIGDTAELKYNSKTGLIWIDKDLKMLKSVIVMRILMIVGIALITMLMFFI